MRVHTRISNFTRESNNKCWTFTASQVYRRYRRFTRGCDKNKKKKKEREGEQIEITAAGYPKDGDYRRLNEKPDTLWAFQRQRPTPMLYHVCFRRFFFLAEFYEDFLFHTGHSYSVISISFG